MTLYVLANAVNYHGSILSPGKQIDDAVFDTVALTAAGAVLVAQSTPVLARAATLLKQQQRGQGAPLDIGGPVDEVTTQSGGGGGGGTVPTGTGFYHVTGGAADAASRAVNLATADVTGVLPTGNQAAQTPALGGSLGGTTAAATVLKADGAAGVFDVAAGVDLVFNDASPAAAGAIRFANARSALINRNNVAGTADIAVIAAAANNLTFGDIANTNFVDLVGTNRVRAIVGGGYGLFVSAALGFVYLPALQVNCTDDPGGLSDGIMLTPLHAGAMKIEFAQTLTSAVIQIVASAALAAGKKLSLLGQNCSAGGSTGGDLEIGPGTGAAANGALSLINLATTAVAPGAGGAGALPATPAGYASVKINGVARQIPYY